MRDVWSIGVLLLQCLSADRLKSFADVDKAIEAVNVPPEIRRFLAACVANDPADRPRNASDLLASLVAAQKRRVGRAAEASATPVWLRLGNKATESLAGSSNSREAQATMRADLSGDVFASYVPDPESGEPKRDAIFLVGDSWRYHLIPPDGAFVAAARQLELEALERLRRRSLLLPSASPGASRARPARIAPSDNCRTPWTTSFPRRPTVSPPVLSSGKETTCSTPGCGSCPLGNNSLAANVRTCTTGSFG